MISVDIDFNQSLYVACALAGAPEQYRIEVEELKLALERDHGINVLKFLGLGDNTPLEVYEHDIRMVKNCSAFLGIYGYLSDGRGMETERAFMRDIPMLGVAQRGTPVSKMITGGYESHDKPFIFVEDLQREVPALVLTHFIKSTKVL